MEQTILEIWQSIAQLNDDYTQLSIDVAVLKAQVGQILWLQRIVLGLIIAFVATKILTKVFNNKK